MGFGGQYGYYTDRETGLVLMGHRYYDPGTGRFLTRDPIGYGGGMNLYGYADGNPVNESDPDGFAPPPGPYSGPGIDWAKVGAWATRYLNAGTMRRAANYAARANAEDNFTPAAQSAPDVNSGASPNARVSAEIEAETARINRPMVLPGVRPYNSATVPGYDLHHLDPPYGPHPPGYGTDITIPVRNDNLPRRVPGGVNAHTGPGGFHQSLDAHLAELGYTRAQYRALPTAQRRVILRRYYAGVGIPFAK